MIKMIKEESRKSIQAKINPNPNNSNLQKNYTPNNRLLKKINLCQKYFYRNIKEEVKKKNLIRFMEQNMISGDPVEQVDKAICNTERNSKILEEKKINCLRSMILHHRNIPEKWINQRNYKQLLNKAMKDQIVLSYVIENKEHFRVKTNEELFDEMKIKKYNLLDPDNIGRKKNFISFINPNSSKNNYKDSNKKALLRKEYGNSVKNKSFRTINNESNENNKGDMKIKDLKKGNLSNLKKNIITKENKKGDPLPLICLINGRKDENLSNNEIITDNDEVNSIMLTSINNGQTQEWKNRKDNIKSNEKDKNDNKKKDNKNYINVELPKIDF